MFCINLVVMATLTVALTIGNHYRAVCDHMLAWQSRSVSRTRAKVIAKGKFDSHPLKIPEPMVTKIGMADCTNFITI